MTAIRRWLGTLSVAGGALSLAGRSEPRARSLARALMAAMRGQATPDERAWFERIEALRARLLASTDEVRLVDFGAGSPESGRSEEEMLQGRTVTKPVGQLTLASKSPFWARTLFQLVRAFGPQTCIELGTAVGISACYQAAALKLNGGGRLVTMEGADALAAIAEENFSQLGLDNVRVVRGRFSDTLADVLSEVGPVDYAFVDGHHDEKATLDYLERIAPHLAPGALVVFDDIRWSQGMRRAWTAIRAHPSIWLAVDLRLVGVCLFRE